MMESKRVVVAGATGLIGRAICALLLAQGYTITVFSRDPVSARGSLPGATEYIAWQPEKTGPWSTAIDGAWAVINLAGAPFFKKWTEAYKREVRESRIFGTRGLIHAISQAQDKPQVYIGGGSVGYYGFVYKDGRRLSEETPAGQDYWGKDSLSLEQEMLQAEAFGVRTVVLRTGVVLARSGSALQGQREQFEHNFGGYVWPGTQWYPWIHIDDVAGLILFALENTSVHHGLNVTAPEPQTNRDFARTLGKILGKPAWLPVPPALIKTFLGEVSVTVTHGQRVVPEKALNLGYQFLYPTSELALRDLLS
jgi:uncharacterized protein (TIGR01777 family)